MGHLGYADASVKDALSSSSSNECRLVPPPHPILHATPSPATPPPIDAIMSTASLHRTMRRWTAAQNDGSTSMLRLTRDRPESESCAISRFRGGSRLASEEYHSSNNSSPSPSIIRRHISATPPRPPIRPATADLPFVSNHSHSRSSSNLKPLVAAAAAVPSSTSAAASGAQLLASRLGFIAIGSSPPPLSSSASVVGFCHRN